MTQRVALSRASLVVLFFSIFGSIGGSTWGFAQSLPDVASVKDLPSTSRPSPKYQRLKPLSIRSQPDFMHSAPSSSSITTGTFGIPFSPAHVISVPTFQVSFISRGKTWHFAMMGTAPWDGGSTTIPTHIVAVSLRLQNANLTSFTTIPMSAFETPTLNSPDFKAANYSSGPGIQFADAVQRAEFFHKMKAGWHTILHPAMVHSVTITVPRFINADVNGFTTKVQTYFTSKASDGRTVVFLLDQFFNLQIFNIVTNEIKAGRFTTGALNVALFPNTYLFSLNSSGGIGNCCVLGFHTFFTDTALTESRWVFAFASWVSPGVFSGFQDVTALSHEISEAIDDPFVNNLGPGMAVSQRARHLPGQS